MQDAIIKFSGSKGTWKLIGTKSTGRNSCIDTYRLEGSDEYQENNREDIHALAAHSKITPIPCPSLNDLPTLGIKGKKHL